MKQIQNKVNKVFIDAFGRTPTRQRLEDIFKESLELLRSTDFDNMKEEAGDLLASTIMLCNENHLDFEELIEATLSKIKRRDKQYKSLGRKTSVVLIGGAFDPITEGHVKLAKFILDTSTMFDEAWIAPCFRHLNGKNMASPEHRLEMCKIACKSDLRLKVFPYEIDNEFNGETYHLVKRLLEEKYAKDEYDFSIAMGMDNANTFDKWVNYIDLEKMIRFVVISRKGVEPNPKVNWYLKPPHIYLKAEKEIPEISSSEVKALLNNGYKAEGYLNPEVYEYICKNRLYRWEK